jgi:hypothetical protein
MAPWSQTAETVCQQFLAWWFRAGIIRDELWEFFLYCSKHVRNANCETPLALAETIRNIETQSTKMSGMVLNIATLTVTKPQECVHHPQLLGLTQFWESHPEQKPWTHAIQLVGSSGLDNPLI